MARRSDEIIKAALPMLKAWIANLFWGVRGQKNVEFLSLAWDPVTGPKKQSEDASLQEGLVMVVADGVTRFVSGNQEYPHPSPARMAADMAVHVAAELLAKASPSQEVIRQAFEKANRAIAALNSELGLGRGDYLEGDYAGTVASAAMIDGDRFVYGFIGDCGVARISPEAELLWHTPDEVTPARPYFPSVGQVGLQQRFIRVRRDFRNRNDGQPGGFGVLTGEPSAMNYVRTGIEKLKAGDALVLYSDGAMPFVLNDRIFRELICVGSEDEIREYIIRTMGDHTDEKTLLIARPFRA